MTKPTTRLLLNETLSPGTRYVGLQICREEGTGSIGATVYWSTSAFAATFAIEVTSFDEHDAANDAATPRWVDSGVTIAAATGAAAGARSINVENVRQKRARLKIVTSVAGFVQIAGDAV